jgi:hypothetical protein
VGVAASFKGPRPTPKSFSDFPQNFRLTNDAAKTIFKIVF